MKPLILVLTLAVASAACADSSGQIHQARQSLTHYALASCLAEAYPAAPGFTDDAKRAAGAYHFMGRGAHRPLQDEDTLEVLHDPYAAVKQYILQAAADEPAVLKHGGTNAFAGCLQVLSTPEFQALVQEQDGYISAQD